MLTLCPSRRVERVWSPARRLPLQHDGHERGHGLRSRVPDRLHDLPRRELGAGDRDRRPSSARPKRSCTRILASCMPRSGGEYYFQARIISTGAGSVFCFSAIVLGGTMWVAVTGWCAAHLAVGPLLVALGVASHSAGSHRRGRLGPEPLGRPAAVHRGHRLVGDGHHPRAAHLRQLQRWFWVVAGVALLAVVVGLLRVRRPRQSARVPGGERRGARLGYSAGHGLLRSRRPSRSCRSPATCSCTRAGARSRPARRRRASELRVQLFIILGAMLASAALSALLGRLVVAEVRRLDAGRQRVPLLRAPRPDAAARPFRSCGSRSTTRRGARLRGRRRAVLQRPLLDERAELHAGRVARAPGDVVRSRPAAMGRAPSLDDEGADQRHRAVQRHVRAAVRDLRVHAVLASDAQHRRPREHRRLRDDVCDRSRCSRSCDASCTGSRPRHGTRCWASRRSRGRVRRSSSSPRGWCGATRSIPA